MVKHGTLWTPGGGGPIPVNTPRIVAFTNGASQSDPAWLSQGSVVGSNGAGCEFGIDSGPTIEAWLRVVTAGDPTAYVWGPAGAWASVAMLEFASVSPDAPTVTAAPLPVVTGGPLVFPGLVATAAGTIVVAVGAKNFDKRLDTATPINWTPPGGAFVEQFHLQGPNPGTLPNPVPGVAGPATISRGGREWTALSVGYLPVGAAGVYSLTWGIVNDVTNERCRWPWGGIAVFLPGASTFVQSVYAAAASSPGTSMTPTFGAPP